MCCLMDSGSAASSGAATGASATGAGDASAGGGGGSSRHAKRQPTRRSRVRMWFAEACGAPMPSRVSGRFQRKSCADAIRSR
jgi:hypothetical protein